MNRIFILILYIFLFLPGLRAQDTLFDQTRVSSVYITIPPDSLEAIMTDVLSDHYYLSRFVYDFGSGSDTVENAGFRLRGNTSRFAEKKSFKVSFNEYEPGRRYKGVKKINLNGQHNDPTMIREKLFYDLWNKAGMPARRTSFVRLFINGEYFGLYTNLEEPDKDWLERVYGENDGNLYKCTYPTDLNYYGTSQQVYKDIPSSSVTGGRAYDLQTNEAQDDYADLVGLISVLYRPPDTAFPDAISDVLDVATVLKAYAIDVATGNWDDYFYNKNNYFLYDRQPSGKFSFLSYDTDNTFGVDFLGIDWTTRSILQWYKKSEPRPMITKLLAVPQYNTLYKQYLDTIARFYILPDSIFPHIDDLKNLIKEAAIGDTYRTLDYGYTVSDFFDGFTGTIDGHTPYGIKPFLTKRYNSIIEQLKPAGIDEAGALHIMVYPNPAIDKVFIKGDLPGPYTILLTDLRGMTVFRADKQGSPETDVSGVPRGFYLLQILCGNRSASFKLILQ